MAIPAGRVPLCSAQLGASEPGAQEAAALDVGGSKKTQAGSERGRPGPSLLSRWLPGMSPWNHQARQVMCVRWIGLHNYWRFPLSDHAQRGRSWGVTRITGARAFALCPRFHPRCPPLGVSSIRTKNKKNGKNKRSKNTVVVVSVYRCVLSVFASASLCSVLRWSVVCTAFVINDSYNRVIVVFITYKVSGVYECECQH